MSSSLNWSPSQPEEVSSENIRMLRKLTLNRSLDGLDASLRNLEWTDNDPEYARGVACTLGATSPRAPTQH